MTLAGQISDEELPLLASNHAPNERQRSRVRSGAGVWLTLEDGRVVLDAGSLSSCILGHCHPDVVAAVREAAGIVYVNDGVGYEPRERAAADLLKGSFDGEAWAETVTLTVSASEATDLALLLAQMLTGRTPLVSREWSYHGGVGLGREVSAHPLYGAHLAAPEGGVTLPPRALVETRHLPVPLCGLVDCGPDHVCSERCLGHATMALRGAAAVIMDYTQGGVCPSPAYQDAVAGLARREGALWIADETVTAFGRLGHTFAFQRGASRPDIVALGKGITAGAVAGGALVLSRDVVAAIGERRWMTAATYRGNPITVAAMSAVQKTIQRESLVSRAATLGAGIGGDLRALVGRHQCLEAVHGDGLMWIIRLAGASEHRDAVWAGDGSALSLPEIVHEAALDRGVFIGVLSGQCLWLVPPLTITAAQLADAVAALDLALGVADRELERCVG